jgi:hypothetical protein
VEAPESMSHASGDGGVRVIVLNACMRWPWSKDGGGAVYVGADGGATVDGPALLGGHEGVHVIGEGTP